MDQATLYAVSQALKTIGITVSFHQDAHGVLIAERPLEEGVCQRPGCGHYRWTHLVNVPGCNGACTCQGFLV
jgi:hypothetical protein